MILVRSPLRISLGGGGTDLPSYYQKFGGELLAASIKKYVYVSISRPFRKGIYLKYSKQESIGEVSEVEHPIIREALKYFPIDDPQIEITTLADIPSGTGLGSSGSFTVALLKALSVYFNVPLNREALAELACEIEIEKLREPIGKQDQFASAIGGLTQYIFNPDGKVTFNKLNSFDYDLTEFEDSLCLFFTGFTRSAGSILSDQKQKSEADDLEMLSNLHSVKRLGQESLEAIKAGNYEELGALMHAHWEAKRKRSTGMSNERIDQLYRAGISAGAYGGKLVGAGGGGFLLFVADNALELRHRMMQYGLEEVPIKFDYAGTELILNDG